VSVFITPDGNAAVMLAEDAKRSALLWAFLTKEVGTTKP